MGEDPKIIIIMMMMRARVRVRVGARVRATSPQKATPQSLLLERSSASRQALTLSASAREARLLVVVGVRLGSG